MKPIRAYFGHHKCASTWIVEIINGICHEMGLKTSNFYNPSNFNSNLREFVEINKIDFIEYVNADMDDIRDLGLFIGFHVIRDPRDILVSSYFSSLYSHPTKDWPELIPHRENLRNANKDEGLFLELDFLKDQFNQMYHWDYSTSHILELKMEELTAKPYEKFVEIFTFLEMLSNPYDISKRAEHILKIGGNKLSKNIFRYPIFKLKSIPLQNLLFHVYNNRFSVKSGGREPGQEDTHNHYRKGVSGDWKNHFNNMHKQAFKEKYNNLLIKLKYETASDW